MTYDVYTYLGKGWPEFKIAHIHAMTLEAALCFVVLVSLVLMLQHSTSQPKPCLIVILMTNYDLLVENQRQGKKT